MSKLIKGIHHAAVYYKDEATFNRGVALYVDVLGLTELRRWGKDGTPCVMLDTGVGILELFSNADEHRPVGTYGHVALATDDPDACIAAVRAAGYEVTVEPKDVAFPCEVPAYARLAFFRGPAGEEIEFFAER